MSKLPAIHRPGRLPKPSDETPNTPAKIRAKAEELLATDRSNLRNEVVERLYEFVTLTEETLFKLVFERIAISEKRESFHNRLNAYARQGLIMPVSRAVLKEATRAGLPNLGHGILRAYRLGPVGVEIAKVKFVTQLSGPMIDAIEEDRLAHDLICAEAMLKMAGLWLTFQTPGKAEVRGPRKVAIWDEENNKAFLAPDGLIIKRDIQGDVFQRAFVVEYHNNNAKMHVENKITRYEKLTKEGGWWTAWDLPEEPLVLVLYRQESTLVRYKDLLYHLPEKGGVQGGMAKYASVSLEGVWAGKLAVLTIKPESRDKEG